jgi:membrane-associated phospholipid phosphatase
MSMGNAPRAVTVLIVLLVLALAQPAAAQPGGGDRSGGAGPPLTLAGAGRNFLRDAGRIWSSPSRIKTRDIAPLLAVAATATFLIAADERIRDTVQEYVGRHPWVGDVGPAITPMGYLTFFVLGLVLKDARASDTSYLAASAMVHALLVDNTIKSLTGRQRPYNADGIDHWSGPSALLKRFGQDSDSLYGSFPSGHTANAFSLATVIALQYRHRVWVPILAYAVASSVGLSRMTLDKHWASDVFCGAILGYSIGRLVVRNYDRRRRLVPMLACSRNGVALSLVYDLGPAGP